jgi:uncharacterized protein YijF (DUF1287 family)
MFIELLFAATIGFNVQDNFFTRLFDVAFSLTEQQVRYDPSYFVIPYPNGDIPQGKGVCTDVIIRAYRGVGIDLQQKVHEDMQKNFHLYPKLWGLEKTDKNIDHRRVPNLMKFLERYGSVLQISQNPNLYSPGDIVTWDLGNGIGHIGIVINKKSGNNSRYLIVHNIGNGQEVSDCLFDFKITGHYRYNSGAN